MFGIIGEAESDVETLMEIVRKLSGEEKLKIPKKGYNGCAEMFIKSPKYLKVLSDLGCKKFIICYDSDGKSPDERQTEIIEKIIRPSGVNGTFCALVPVQEIEAWILADLCAVKKVISSFEVPNKEIRSPEGVPSPKENLEKLTRKNAKPLYSHAIHNPKVAKHLDLSKVKLKCPSFVALYDLVISNIGNVDEPSTI